jgi:predicted nuclease of predicted toxin-antitoxin system
LTHDKDFGELVFRQNLANSGVVLLRLHGLSQDSKTHVVLTALEDYGEQMAKAFTVISPGILRIRRRMELVS